MLPIDIHVKQFTKENKTHVVGIEFPNCTGVGRNFHEAMIEFNINIKNMLNEIYENSIKTRDDSDTTRIDKCRMEIFDRTEAFEDYSCSKCCFQNRIPFIKCPNCGMLQTDEDIETYVKNRYKYPPPEYMENEIEYWKFLRNCNGSHIHKYAAFANGKLVGTGDNEGNKLYKNAYDTSHDLYFGRIDGLIESVDGSFAC